jgi:Zn-dependent membrane protease YugP
MYGYGYGYYSMFDPTMILVLIGVFLSLGASAKVKSTYARFSRVRHDGSRGGETAFKFTGHL